MRCDHCPVRPGPACLGETHDPVCRDVEAGLPGRAEQLVAIAEGRLTTGSVARPTSEALARVRECPERGGVLPISMQPEGCMKCGEKSECRAGKGEIPGRVSLRECLECVSRP